MTGRRIKVVFGVNDFLTGGMQRQLAEQLRFYDRERFEITVVTLFAFPGATLYAEIPEGITVHRLSFRGIADIASWRSLATLLSQLQPDIVVSSLFFSNLAFRVLKPRFGYVSIAREHNTNADRPFWQRLANRLLAPRSYRIVAVSRTVATFTATHEGILLERFQVIHNGIDSARMQEQLAPYARPEELQKEAGFAPDTTVLLNVSRLIPQKNHHLLLEGFAQFWRTHPSYRLAIVGGGPLEDELTAYVRTLGIADAVTFFGHQDQVARFYRLADVFVATSTIEGFSNALLEALAAGLPAVATRTAGTDEVIEDGRNGFFIDVADASAVCAALTKLDQSAHAALSEAARATAARFDIRESVRAYETLFEESLAQTP